MNIHLITMDTKMMGPPNSNPFLVPVFLLNTNKTVQIPLANFFEKKPAPFTDKDVLIKSFDVTSRRIIPIPNK
jgi:hypothetical protein